MPIDFTAIVEAFKAAVPFIPVTLRLAFIPLFIGMIFGLLIALARFFQVPVLSKFLAALITIGKGVPVVLSLMVAYLLFSDLFDQVATSLSLPIRFSDINREYIGILSLVSRQPFPFRRFFVVPYLPFQKTNGMQRHPLV
ncbi:hypothetical protein [Aerococcus urinaeequi]|uniref:hypothetical protein n=1 Tax=Aerococcus urinaeequi TaxID=51665 RepID=UPI003AB0D6F8